MFTFTEVESIRESLLTARDELEQYIEAVGTQHPQLLLFRATLKHVESAIDALRIAARAIAADEELKKHES